MTRDHALRVDGMLRGALGHLDTVARYMKENFPSNEFDSSVRMIGAAMTEIVELSMSLHKAHPDIIPDDMKP